MNRYAIVTCEFTFEASHHYRPSHCGQCQRPHRPIYRLQISLRGPIIEAPGKSEDDMVIDIEELKRSVNMLIFAGILCGQTYSGLNQNDPNTFTGIRTTPGNLVHRIWDALVAGGIADHLLYRIRLWETERSSLISRMQSEKRME